MQHKKENLVIWIFVGMFLLIAMIEIIIDYKWISIIALIVFYLIVYGITALACLSIKKCDKRIEFLIYVVMISMTFLSGKFFLYLPGLLFLIFSRNEIAYISKIVATCVIGLTFAYVMMFGMVKNDLVVRGVMRETISPNGAYVVEQVYHNGYAAGQAVKINLHKELLGVLDISYNVQLNQNLVLSEVEWIGEDSFLLDGVLFEVKF